MRSTFLATFFPPFFSLIIEHCIVCKLTFIRSRCSHDLNICLASYTQLYSCHSSMPIAYWHDVTVFSLFFSLLEVCIREWPPLFSSRCNAVMCKKKSDKKPLEIFLRAATRCWFALQCISYLDKDVHLSLLNDLIFDESPSWRKSTVKI